MTDNYFSFKQYSLRTFKFLKTNKKVTLAYLTHNQKLPKTTKKW